MSKVAIVGVEGSGKTVLMAALAEAYGQATHDGVYLMPENQAAFSFMTQIPHKMRVDRQWPAATAIQSMKYLKWTVRIGQEVLAELEMLDYPGELYRLAFGDRNEEEIEGNRAQVHEFLEHLVTANDLIVLFNLKDAMDIGANARNNETVWLTRGIFDYAKKLPNIKYRLLLFTQADRYQDVMERVGGAKVLQNKYLPMLAILHPDLQCGAVSAVESANADRPAPASKVGNGLSDLMKRMVSASEPGKRAIHLLSKCRDAAGMSMQVHENLEAMGSTVRDFSHALEAIGALESKAIEFLQPEALAELKAQYKQVHGFWADIIAIAKDNDAKVLADESAWKDVLGKYRDEAAFVATIRNLIREKERKRIAGQQKAKAWKILMTVAAAIVALWLAGYGAWQFHRAKALAKLTNETRLSQSICEQAYTGSSNAQYEAGLAYLNLDDLGYNYQKAFKWLEKAAKQGHSAAQNHLGLMYAKGRGVAKDDAEAVKWYRMAVDHGHADAQFSLGFMYAAGRGVAKDDAEAVKWYRLAADQGNASAQNNLGFMYFEGRGVAQDDADAVKWYRLAAKQGLSAAQINLGCMYAKGRGMATDDVEAVKCYRKAADQGNADAQSRLGAMYAEGRGVARDDVEAVKCFRKAAEQGNANAQFRLGAKYADGRGVAKDDAEAVKWYRMAVDHGHADAQFSLGFMYAAGRGVAKDDAEAVKWYRLAADQGNASAQFWLGWMYESGRGVAKDVAEAAKWYRLVTDQGAPRSAKGAHEALK